MSRKASGRPPYFIPGQDGVQEFGALRRRHVKVSVLTNSLAATDEPFVHAGYARYRADLLREGVILYELSPTLMRRNKRIVLPGKSLGRLHTKSAVIDRSTVYIGSMNLDPRSENTNSEDGILAECPALAREVTRVIGISELTSTYRPMFAADGQTLEWLTTDDQGEVMLREEPEVTPFTRLRDSFLGHFVPERLL
jgi:cardiolipin synthase C